MNSANETAIDLLKVLAEQGFWGNVALKFQRGEVVHIIKEESIQTVPQCRRNKSDISKSR
jgi:hypothetical protein